MGHDHAHAQKEACAEPTVRCALKVTPTFAPDGSLWLAFMAAGRVWVAQSRDLGRSFSQPVSASTEPSNLDWGPDARPKIAADRDGRLFVAFAVFKDEAFNGRAFYTRSVDGGRSFATPLAITADPESQRFEAIALNSDGSLFAAWLDKRNRIPAKARNEEYAGAALAFTWSYDHGATVSETWIAHDNTCECCRLGIAFAGPGRPVIIFRNIFAGSVRDHAVTTFANRWTPGPVYRVSVDDWKTEGCPHAGPSLTLAPDGSYHVARYTNGTARSGLFYASSSDGGRNFSAPMPVGASDRSPSNPYLIAARNQLWLAWKEFDGNKTTVPVMSSSNGGRTWSEPKIVADTADESDHPVLVSNGAQAFLSWQTRAESYRFIALEDAQ
jgi:hypothetical protein